MHKMLAFDPNARLSLEDVKNHPWYKGQYNSPDELKKEFLLRKQRVDASLL